MWIEMKPHRGGNYPHRGGSEGHTKVEEHPHGGGREGHYKGGEKKYLLAQSGQHGLSHAIMHIRIIISMNRS